MSKATKIWLIAAASLILVGAIIFALVMTVLKWNFTKLSTSEYETNNYDIIENYTSISIITDTSDILLVPSSGSSTSVTCYEQKNVKHSVFVKDGALVIELKDTRKWYEHIGINFGSPKITVSMPAGEYGALSVRSSTGKVEIPKDLSFESIDITATTGYVKNYASAAEHIKIKTTTGGISVENVSATSLDLSVSTGKVAVSNVKCEGNISVSVTTGKAYLTDIVCDSLRSDGDTGEITLKNVIVSKKLSIERDTGDVKFDKCDAAEIHVETDTGDVTGTLLSEKIFFTKTDTGKINVPKTTSGGKCDITTDTGDIKITLE